MYFPTKDKSVKKRLTKSSCNLKIHIINSDTGSVIDTINTTDKHKNIDIKDNTDYYFIIDNDCGLVNSVFLIELFEFGHRTVKSYDDTILHCYDKTLICGYGKYKKNPFRAIYLDHSDNTKRIKLIFREYIIENPDTLIKTHNILSLKFKINVIPK
jgi:hypothetical protein